MTIAIFITARLKSRRLPRKVVAPIAGRPMLSRMIERLRLAASPDRIVVCTSSLPEDRPLVELAEELGVDHFCGHADDVLDRLRGAADAFAVDLIASCTADNPLTDPGMIDRQLAFHEEGGYDYTMPRGLPIGTFAYTLSTDALHRACELKASQDTEIWGAYFTEPGVFDVGVFEVEDPGIRAIRDARLTVDWPEDLELIRTVHDRLYSDGALYTLPEIARLLREEPELKAINGHREQRTAGPAELKQQQER